MNEYSGDVPVAIKPSKLIPVLIGGAAMVVITEFPVLNLVNLACCAGVMGAAVLGVWFYKRGFPPGLPFSVGDGAAVGTLSGVVGGAMWGVVTVLTSGMLSADFAITAQDELEEAFANASVQGADPAAVEAMMDLFMGVAASPAVLILVTFLFSIALFTAFGALGGVIGGAVFKTKLPPPQTLPPMANNSAL